MGPFIQRATHELLCLDGALNLLSSSWRLSIREYGKGPMCDIRPWCTLMFPALICCWFPVASVHLSPAVFSSERVLHHLHTALPTATVGLSSLILSQLSAQVLLVSDLCSVCAYVCVRLCTRGSRCFPKVGNRRCHLWMAMCTLCIWCL